MAIEEVRFLFNLLALSAKLRMSIHNEREGMSILSGVDLEPWLSLSAFADKMGEQGRPTIELVSRWIVRWKRFPRIKTLRGIGENASSRFFYVWSCRGNYYRGGYGLIPEFEFWDGIQYGTCAHFVPFCEIMRKNCPVKGYKSLSEAYTELIRFLARQQPHLPLRD